MAEKLKSILKQIPWSLALRAFVFGASWLLLPFWAFLLLSLYFYLFPFFQPVRFAVHFAILIFFMAAASLGFVAAVFFSIVFYLLLGLKDFRFTDRRSAYETFLILFVFMFASRFYFFFETRQGISPLFYVLFFGIIFFFLSRGLFGYSATSFELVLKNRSQVSRFILAVLLCQLMLGIAVLPLDFLYQTSFFFLSAVVLIESVFDYLYGVLTSRRLLANFSIFFVFVVIILGFAPWSL
ncbi:MAG: hypothetical protein A3B25_00870 [Candidatus Ryanbacteria bacterium RIFCSPLOWO2_01_FULL_48_26]|uniref:Uncharacterized protein n=1 Tax=Candidatus Ryanbacteria bacterium RIFCSPLOWO2_01_FULL_48_26 TaxID=1802126 RepID=A0A1G2GR98_9BACT|nr:MAG: hypothetical protein A3B25_00870 [Candidatus Ryanbacteria bacterium RIFCSPLOWO2_01_FULL_48_26]